jgi:hypothetical protein
MVVGHGFVKGMQFSSGTFSQSSVNKDI